MRGEARRRWVPGRERGEGQRAETPMWGGYYGQVLGELEVGRGRGALAGRGREPGRKGAIQETGLGGVCWSRATEQRAKPPAVDRGREGQMQPAGAPGSRDLRLVLNPAPTRHVTCQHEGCKR